MHKLRTITRTPPRIFSIGDIHGCPDELGVMLNFLEQDQGLSPEDQVVFIGDYIDRGPSSKGVVDRLIEFKIKYPETVFLRGNHEDMLLDFLGFGGNMGGAYPHNGAKDTLGSYEIPLGLSPEEIAHKLPREHFSFYLNLESYILLGDYVYVHAGVNPLRDLVAQLDYDLFWIRDEFISNIHSFRKTVVFGHTPYQDVLFHLPFKIGIDTGLVYGNMLTCIEVMNKKIFQVDRSGESVKVKDFPKKSM